MKFEALMYSIDADILTLTLNRPDKLNEFDGPMMNELLAAFDAADAKEGVTSLLEKRPARFANKVSTDMPAFFPWWQPRPYE